MALPEHLSLPSLQHKIQTCNPWQFNENIFIYRRFKSISGGVPHNISTGPFYQPCYNPEGDHNLFRPLRAKTKKNSLLHIFMLRFEP